MNRINEFNIEPGPYADEHDSVLVVLDVINHAYDPLTHLPTVIADPLVVLRHLEHTRSEHIRYAYPLSVFNQKFKKL